MNIMLSVIISLHNEEPVFDELLRRLTSTCALLAGDYEIIFIDNGSTDRTSFLIGQAHEKNARVKLIQLSRDFGQAIALRAGLEFAKGNIVVLMDGDLQDQPEEIPKLVNKLHEGYEVVYAQRTGRRDSLFRKISSSFIRKLLSFLIKGGDFPDGDERMLVGVFRVMTKDVAHAIRDLPEHTAYIQGLIRWVGFRQTVVEVQHGKRHKGKSKYSFKNLIAYALDGALTVSSYPLRVVTVVGMLLAGGSFLMGTWHLFYRIAYGTKAPGFTTLVLLLLFIGGMQFIILGIIGEYIGRIYTETKQRPLYIIKKKLL